MILYLEDDGFTPWPNLPTEGGSESETNRDSQMKTDRDTERDRARATQIK